MSDDRDCDTCAAGDCFGCVNGSAYKPDYAKTEATAKKPATKLTLQCLGGPKDGETVAFQGMAYRCCTCPKISCYPADLMPSGITVVHHEYIVKELACGKERVLFLVYNGEVGAGQKPARKGSKMQKTRVAYLVVQKEARDKDGKVVREEKIVRPEKVEDGFAFIDMECLDSNKVREAVLEKEQAFLTEAGLKFADVEVAHPFQR